MNGSINSRHVVCSLVSNISFEEIGMKKLIKKTTIALAFATVLGGTWMASGAYHSSKSDSVFQEAVFVKNVGYSTDALMTSLNEKAEFDMIQSAKSLLSPVKNYFFQAEGETFNGVPVHKACGTVTVNGVTRFF